MNEQVLHKLKVLAESAKYERKADERTSAP